MPAKDTLVIFAPKSALKQFADLMNVLSWITAMLTFHTFPAS